MRSVEFGVIPGCAGYQATKQQGDGDEQDAFHVAGLWSRDANITEIHTEIEPGGVKNKLQDSGYKLQDNPFHGLCNLKPGTPS